MKDYGNLCTIVFNRRKVFAFFSNENKPDKFGIKFWDAACVMSKYLFQGFSCLGKEEHLPAGRL
jgi:hypothetical protein